VRELVLEIKSWEEKCRQVEISKQKELEELKRHYDAIRGSQIDREIRDINLRFQNERAEFENDAKKSKGLIISLQQELDAWRVKYQRVERLEEVIFMLSVEIDRLMFHVIEHRERLIKCESEKNEKDQEVNMIRSSLEYERTIRIESDKKAFAGKTDLLERDLNSMRQALAERNKLCDQLTEELRNSKASLRGQESLFIQLEDLRNQNATLRKDYDQMLAMVSEKNERLERLRVKKRLVKAKLREFTTEMQETGGKIQLLQTEIQRLSNENMEWRRRYILGWDL
jgi:chromosome segregation ATPase